MAMRKNVQTTEGCGCESCATLGFVTSGRKDFKPEPEMRLDRPLRAFCVAKFY